MAEWNGMALTAFKRGLRDQILTSVIVYPVFDPQTVPMDKRPAGIEVLALWDSGAANTSISHKISRELGLKRTTKSWVTHSGGVSLRDNYLINLRLCNTDILFKTLSVNNFQAPANFDVLIGMDIITQGDFAITNLNGNTMMSFRVPSLTHIDFSVSV